MDTLSDKDLLSHWYYKTKSSAMMNMLQLYGPFDSVYDIGAGSGVFSKSLLSSFSVKEAYCVDTGYSEEKTVPYQSGKIYYIRSCSKINSKLVLFMDILEHIEEDSDFLKSYVNKCQSETYIFITVPAFQFIFSGHDIFLGHFRRYSKKSLLKVIKESNLILLEHCYLFWLLFPLVVFSRLINKFFIRYFPKTIKIKSETKHYSPFINTLLSIIHKLDLLFFKKNKWFGLTFVVLAKVK